MAWGAGGALALAALVFWLSERASRGLSVEPRSTERSAELPAARASAPAQASVAERAAPSLAVAPARMPDEATLMAELHRIKDGNPARAIELCRAGNERFPDSADAPERASILIHALAAVGQPSQARGEAETMVNRYPDSNWVREIEQFTGAHRHRNVRLNADGQLETY